ncbi:MAG TPA: hypothetical protein VFC46_10045 [Humisphaera sp.]|nr:hypothetical protein [Humisphaera sp.]
MPYSLPLPKKLGTIWKIKIWDNEILEEPHVTVLRKDTKWRYGLRRRDFMDALFPTNPVAEEVEDDDN